MLFAYSFNKKIKGTASLENKPSRKQEIVHDTFFRSAWKTITCRGTLQNFKNSHFASSCCWRFILNKKFLFGRNFSFKRNFQIHAAIYFIRDKNFPITLTIFKIIFLYIVLEIFSTYLGKMFPNREILALNDTFSVGN